MTLRRLLRRLGAVSFGTVADLLDLAAALPRTSVAGLRTTDVPRLLADDGLRVVDALETDRGEVLADAVLAALVRHRPEAAAPVLARALTHRLDPPPPEPAALPPAPAPGTALLRDGVDEPVTRRTAELLVRIASVPDPTALLPRTASPPDVWARHMHEAQWAVETTGRTRLAAAAQLDLLRCLAVAGVDAATCLGGVWNACSAAVQAHVVADVVDDATWAGLTADLLDALAAP